MRFLYTFLLYITFPFLILRLWWKSRKLPAYRAHLGQRLGLYPFKLDKCIWVHAVSVGETIAAIPLLKQLKLQYPDCPILVTTMTPTGAERVKAALKDEVIHAYLPYDLPGANARFINTMRPKIAIIMETELWPNLLHICRQRHIPICLLNARLSEKSASGYQRIAPLTRQMLQNINVIAAQGHKDRERFQKLGGQNVIFTGNLKFDIEPPTDLSVKAGEFRQLLGKDRFIWVAASTHAGEEEVLLAAHAKLCQQNPLALLILVPRHPERFDAIAQMAKQQFVIARRSLSETCDANSQVYLGDTMGEMMLFYASADVAFVGGSLIERGGHNLLEPGVLGKPILTGKHLFNFLEISEMLLARDALIQVENADQIAEQLEQLMNKTELRTQYGTRALQVVSENRGALSRQLAIVKEFCS